MIDPTLFENFRLKKGWNKTVMAKHLGISVGCYGYILKGNLKNLAKAQKLAKKINVSVKRLI